MRKPRTLLGLAVVTTVIAAGAAIILTTTGVASGGPTPVLDPATSKACHMLADSHNATMKATYDYGRSDNETDRVNLQYLLTLRPKQMQDAYETSPLVMRANFKDAAQMAELIKRDPTYENAYTGYHVAIDAAFQDCAKAGVSLVAFNWDTGNLDPVTSG